MARRSGSSALGDIIRLGENPDFGGGDPYGEEEDEFGDLDDGMNGMDEEQAFKGRRVNGPRTKLSASSDAPVVTLAKSQQDMQVQIGKLAKSVNFLARLEKSRLAKHDEMGGMPGMPGGEPDGDEMGGLGGYADDDPMGLPGEGEEEDHLDLAVGPQLRATGEGTNLNVRKAQLTKAKLAKAQLQKAAAILKGAGYTVGRVSKDDAATSFGEKDSNVTGNRPFDTEDVGEDDTVIQGGPGAGPGPVSKGAAGQIQGMISKAIEDAFTARGIPVPTSATVMKSTAPAPGGVSASQIGKGDAGGVDLNQLFDDLKGRTFGEINRLRVDMGDLSGGVL